MWYKIEESLFSFNWGKKEILYFSQLIVLALV